MVAGARVLRSSQRVPAVAAFAALVALAVASPASALVMQPVDDDSLAAKSRLAVVATVSAVLPPGVPRPVTDYLVAIERYLKGSTAGTSIVVRVPGGLDPASGLELVVPGAPRFREGDRVLLFLDPNDDGSYRIKHLVAGAFHRLEVQGREIAYRNDSEVVAITGAAGAPPQKARDFGRFADWVERSATSRLRPWPDYWTSVAPEPLASVTFLYNLIRDEESGLLVRWFEFDTGGSVNWSAHQTGQVGLTGGGYTEFQQGLTMWNNEAKTPIHLVYRGTTSATGGLQTYDAKNVILFNDPNHEVDDFDCSSGGILAVTSYWRDTSVSRVFKGQRYTVLVGSDIIVNDNLACYFSNQANPSSAAARVFAHELGHSLGLAHSSENPTEQNSTLKEALMYYRNTFAARGATLNSDDQAAIRALYQQGSTGGGGGGGGTPGCPANTLCLLNKRFQVTATWSNQFDGSSGTAGATPNTDLSGFFYFTDKSNVELIVKILDFGGTFKVFYGELTNLHFQMTVTDTQTGRTKTYANTPGDCGAIDNQFEAALVGPGSDGLPGLDAQAGSCVANANTVCLLANRFRLTVDWRNQFDGSSGLGTGKKLSDLTGAFAFTDPANLEILVKTLDFGDHILVLYGSLSNLEYHLHVADTISGAVKNYDNPAGRYCGGIDEHAF